jgi:O-antigen/teichoic acid export membrane protein
LSDSRTQTRRIAYGASARLIGRTAGAIVSLLALREATRYFGPLEWGAISAALSWFVIFSCLGSPGMATYAMREVAKPGVDTGSVFARAITATLVVSTLAAVAAAAIGSLVYRNHADVLTMVLVLALGIPFWGLFLTSGSVLAGRGRSDARAVLDLGSSALLLLATVVVVHSRLHERGYAIAYLGYLVAAGLGALALASWFVRPRLQHHRRGLGGMLRASLPLGQFDIFAIVYSRADSIMLYFISGNRAVALYSVAFQIAAFSFTIPTLLSNALLPEFMSADADRRRFLARRAFDVILTVAVPLPLFGALFARPVVNWITGSQYAGAGPLLAVLVGASAISLLNGYLFQMAIFSGAERGLWHSIATVTAVNLAANALAVTLWGATGAAWVMVLSESTGLFMYWRLYRRAMPSPLGRRYPLSVVVASAGLGACCWVAHVWLGLGPGVGVGTLPRATVLACVYLALLAVVTQIARNLAKFRGTVVT